MNAPRQRLRKLNLERIEFRSDFHKYRKVFRAVLARTLLIGHACVSVYTAAKVDARYNGIYALCIPLFFLETATVLYFRYGCEWKRICTAFVSYLLTMIPVLWILRLNDISVAMTSPAQNVTGNQLNTSAPQQSFDVTLFGNKSMFADVFRGERLTSLLEQSMMILLIICRWLLPRGRIDRNSLSQLLIMYSAISADILDFSDTVTRDEVMRHPFFRYGVLGVWSLSLVQFVVVITTAFTFRRKQRLPVLGTDAGRGDDGSEDKSEVLSILMVFFMQDGPFLVARVYMVYLGVVDYMILFFTLKNLLTLVLGLYRFCVLCGCVANEGNDLLRKSEIARSMESLDTLDDWGTNRKNKQRPIKNAKPVKPDKHNKHQRF
ncbi:TMM26-like protein [Mya arenaria]|uniref:TMM26-like protein n=1 Tax=Mya arenaria TaxID=6604 RepID=A0ABY7FTF9_MYAAR|nr:transmembrane protein 26-like [Mya arenaria]WAR25513.1 TMM26-like protein [Mya arenaria]